MLESREYKRAQKILDQKTPSYRKAYSDRLAWLMAYMAELAYLKFDKPNADGSVTLQLVARALKEREEGDHREDYRSHPQELRLRPRRKEKAHSGALVNTESAGSSSIRSV